MDLEGGKGKEKCNQIIISKNSHGLCLVSPLKETTAMCEETCGEVHLSRT